MPSPSSHPPTVPHTPAPFTRPARRYQDDAPDLIRLFDTLDERNRLPFIAVGRNEDARMILCFVTRTRRLDVLQTGADLHLTETGLPLLQHGVLHTATLATHLQLDFTPEQLFDLALNLCGYSRPNQEACPHHVVFTGTDHESRLQVRRDATGTHVTVNGTAGHPVILLTAPATATVQGDQPWTFPGWRTVLPPHPLDTD